MGWGGCGESCPAHYCCFLFRRHATDKGPVDVELMFPTIMDVADQAGEGVKFIDEVRKCDGFQRVNHLEWVNGPGRVDGFW